MSSNVDGDLHVKGSLTANKFTPPASSIGDDAVKAAAKLAASKLEHQHRQVHAQPNTTATAETRPLHVCYGATGKIKDFRAGSIAPCTGNATITVDLKKNGTSVLCGPITLDNANTARVAEAGTVTTDTMVVGDLLEVVITVNAGTGVPRHWAVLCGHRGGGRDLRMGSPGWLPRGSPPAAW